MERKEGWAEQVPWPTCAQGAGEEAGPGHPDYKGQEIWEGLRAETPCRAAASRRRSSRFSRFEMPFNIWCGGCDSMIAKGVRFNAEKKQVGNYYSTKIWSFTMKSPCCKHEIVIQTDPKNTKYVIISGAQQKTEDFDVEDAETLLLPADEERDKLADPMYWLEHQEEDIRKKKEAEPVLVRLQRLSDSRHSDDYALNRALRDRLRSQKKRVAEEKKSARKMGLGVRLLPPSAEDAATAASVKFASKFEKSRKDKRAAIKAASIFPESSSSASKKKTRPCTEEAMYKSRGSLCADGRQGEGVLMAERRFWKLKDSVADCGNTQVATPKKNASKESCARAIKSLSDLLPCKTHSS